MRSEASTVEAYLAELPEDRRGTVEAVRALVREHLPEGYEEGMELGMISYHVPLARSPRTDNGRPLGYVALASQKRYLSLYLMGVYAEREGRFRAAYAASGKRLDMGKSCLRFRRLDDLALDVIAEEIAATGVDDLIAYYEAARRR